MPDRTADFRAFLRLLRQRQVSGEAGRVEIANRLASMTLDELRRVPPWVIVRLGPRGLALLAERSRVIRVRDGGSPQPASLPRPAPAKSQPKLSWYASLKRRRPLWWECATKMATTTVVGLVVLGIIPYASRGVHTLGTRVSEYGECGQLDRWTGDCGYVAGSSGLSLAMAAERLALPAAMLAAANPTLDLNRPLLTGTLIRVPRRSGINLR